jgi:hypothetical protein
MISAASYTPASARPQATGTTEFADIGNVVVGFKTEAPYRRRDPAASPLDTPSDPGRATRARIRLIDSNESDAPSDRMSRMFHCDPDPRSALHPSTPTAYPTEV